MLELYVIVGFFGTAAFGYVALRGFATPRSIAELQSQIQEVDTQAFLNLIDREQDDCLRRELRPQAFAKLRRLRIRATLAYLSQACNNARILIAYAERGMTSLNPEAAALARQLAAAAVQFQLLAIAVRSRLYAQYLFPTAGNFAGDFMQSYDQLRSRLQRILALEAPAASARVAAGI